MQISEIIQFLAASELTIASDAITITQASHKLQPQTGTADDLSTINGTSAGQFGVLYVSDFGTDTITIKHNVGNILCVSGADIAMSYGCLFWYSNGTKVFVAGDGGGSGAPFIDSTAIIKGSADATKLLRFEVDGFTAGNTRVLTPPNYDGTIATLAGTEVLINKEIQKRRVIVSNAAEPAINVDNGDVFVIIGQNTAITSLTTNLTGTPANDQMMMMRITDDGTSRTIAPGASFVGTANNTLSGLTTVANKTLILLWCYNGSVWELLGKDQSL